MEALLGFLILSIGMLGIASLQAISLKAGKTSVYNSVVIMKMDELFESMRANSSATALTAYIAGEADMGTDNGCIAAACTVAQLAQEDIFWWKKNLKAGLPDAATATVAVVAAVVPSKMSMATITIEWQERSRDTEVAVDKSFSVAANICTENPC